VEEDEAEDVSFDSVKARLSLTASSMASLSFSRGPQASSSLLLIAIDVDFPSVSFSHIQLPLQSFL
jgi:hypothetical protein